MLSGLFRRKATGQIAQGDVLLVPIDALPVTAERETIHPSNLTVLAYGEVTGHAHRVHGETRHFRDTKQEHISYLQVIGKDVSLKHEEHGPHALTTGGLYQVVKQREFPREAPPRQVAD